MSAVADSIRDMTGSGELVLVLNSGSSTVKFALLHPDTGERLLGGLADQVGIAAVYRICAFLPLLGVLTIFLPRVERRP